MGDQKPDIPENPAREQSLPAAERAAHPRSAIGQQPAYNRDYLGAPGLLTHYTSGGSFPPLDPARVLREILAQPESIGDTGSGSLARMNEGIHFWGGDMRSTEKSRHLRDTVHVEYPHEHLGSQEEPLP